MNSDHFRAHLCVGLYGHLGTVFVENSLRLKLWVPLLKIKSLGNFGVNSSFTKWITKSFWFETQNANEHEWFDWTYVDNWFSRKSKAERYRPGFHALPTRTKLTIAIGPLIEDLMVEDEPCERDNRTNVLLYTLVKFVEFQVWNLNWNKTLKFRPGLGISDFSKSKKCFDCILYVKAYRIIYRIFYNEFTWTV